MWFWVAGLGNRKAPSLSTFTPSLTASLVIALFWVRRLVGLFPLGAAWCLNVSHEEYLFALNYIKRCWLPLLSQWVPSNSTILYYIILLLTQYYCHHLMFPRRNHCDSIGYRTRHDFSWLALDGLETVLQALTTNRPLGKYSISLSSTAKPIILYSSPTDSHQLQRHHN